MPVIRRAKGEKPEHHAITPRPGWTQEQEYIALSDEFFAVEENRDALAEQLRRAVATLTSVRVWAEIVRDRHSDAHVRRHMRMLLGLLDGEDPDTFGGQ